MKSYTSLTTQILRVVYTREAAGGVTMSDGSAPLLSLSLDTAHKGSEDSGPAPMDAHDELVESQPPAEAVRNLCLIHDCELSSD